MSRRPLTLLTLLCLPLGAQDDKTSTGAVPVDEVIARFQKYSEQIKARSQAVKDAYGKLNGLNITLSYDAFFFWHPKAELEKAVKALQRIKGVNGKPAEIARADVAPIDDGMKLWETRAKQLDDRLAAVKGEMEGYLAMREKLFATNGARTEESERLALDLALKERALFPRLHEIKYDLLERASFVSLGVDRARSEQLLRSIRGLPGQEIPTLVDGERMYPGTEAHRKLWGFHGWLMAEQNWFRAFVQLHSMWLDTDFYQNHEVALMRSVGQMSLWVKEADVVYFEEGMRRLKADHVLLEKELQDLAPTALRAKRLNELRAAGKLDGEGSKELDRLTDELNLKFAALRKNHLEKTYFQEIGNEKDRYLITGFFVNDRKYEQRKGELETAIREGESELQNAEKKAEETGKQLAAETSVCEEVNKVVRKLKEAADDAAARAALLGPEDKEKSAAYRDVEARLQKARRAAERSFVRLQEEDEANRRNPSDTGAKTVEYYRKEHAETTAIVKELESALAKLQDSIGFTARRSKAAADAVELARKYRERAKESQANAAKVAEAKDRHEKALDAVDQARKKYVDAVQAMERLKSTVALRITAAKVYDDATLYYDAFQWAPKEGLDLIDQSISELDERIRQLDDLRSTTKGDFLRYNAEALTAGENYEDAIMQSAFFQAAVETAYFGSDIIRAMGKGGPVGLVKELANKVIDLAVFGPMKLEEAEIQEISESMFLPTRAKVEETAAKRFGVKQQASNATGIIAAKYVESQAQSVLKQELQDRIASASEMKELLEAAQEASKKFKEAVAKGTLIKGLKANASSFLEGLAKDLSKAALKKALAEWFEAEAAMDYFAKQTIAAGATRLYLMASYRYWKAFDLRSDLRKQREAILRTWDPVRGLTTRKNDWFKRGRRLTIDLKAVVPSEDEKKAGAAMPAVEVKLGGQRAERLGDTFAFQVDTSTLKNNVGGVALEVVVDPGR